MDRPRIATTRGVPTCSWAFDRIDTTAADAEYTSYNKTQTLETLRNLSVYPS